MAATLRGLVSKKKKRFQEDGFDLDLTYITPNVIAMGYPSVGTEAMYRNPLPEVQRFFTTRHAGHYKIYNLCSERAYSISEHFPLVERYPFDDHNPCPMSMVRHFCADVQRYLDEDPKNVVGIHCKAGKGRTGLMICCYLLHCGEEATAVAALAKFAAKRTANSKGVTIPSQQRLVHYYEQELRRGPATIHTYAITHIRLVTVPNFDVGGGCDPYFHVRVTSADPSPGVDTPGFNNKKVYDYREHVKKIKKYKNERFVDLSCETHNLVVRHNVKLVFFDWDSVGKDDKMFHLWFNTGYIDNNYLVFQKSVVDKACKDKKHSNFDPGFKVEIFFRKVDIDDDEFHRMYSDTGDDGAGEPDTDEEADED